MESPPANPLLSAALAYADRGWRVLPLHEVLDSRDGPRCSCGRGCGTSAGKHPREPKWQKVATTDAQAIRGVWWKAWPAANVGVALGTGSGIVSIDVDSDEGEQLLRALAGGEPEPTAEFRTGKGRRLLYAIPDTLEVDPRTTARKGGDGSEAVRFQGTGGQCVMPPSLHHSGRRYEWVRDCDPAPMPGWLIAEMSREPAPPTPPKEPRWADQGARDAFVEGLDFNTYADWWEHVLQPAGFKRAGSRGEVIDFTRPGKSGGISVTANYHRAADGTPAMYVFSGSIPELEPERCYDKFGAFARLHCGGDFARAVERIKAMGFAARKVTRPRASGGRPAAKPAGGDPDEGEGVPAEPADWGDPIPLDDGACVVEPFPLDVFPEWLAALCGRIAEAVPCPVDYPAAFALGIAAGAAGSTLALKIKGNWSERPVLYVCVVARPNDGKSPALDPLMEPVVEEHARRVESEKADKEPAYVSDITVESLAGLLQSSPRGLLLVRDELAGWVHSMDQYKAKGSGADRQFWLSNWSGVSINVRRKDKDRPSVFVRRPAVTIVGGIQPAVLDALRGHDDGFFDRMLFSYQTPLPASGENWDAVEEADLAEWASSLSHLRDRKLTAGASGNRPWLVRMDDEAKGEWEKVIAWRAERLNDPELPEPLRGPIGKLSNYAARLALTVYAIRTAVCDTERLPALSGRDMAAGAALVKYFHSHGTKVFRASNRDTRLTLAQKIVGWIRRNRVEKFTRRDAHRAMFGSVDKPEDLVPPLRLLEQLRYIRYGDTPAYAGVGRRPTPPFDVNPAVLSETGVNPGDSVNAVN